MSNSWLGDKLELSTLQVFLEIYQSNKSSIISWTSCVYSNNTASKRWSLLWDKIPKKNTDVSSKMAVRLAQNVDRDQMNSKKQCPATRWDVFGHVSQSHFFEKLFLCLFIPIWKINLPKKELIWFLIFDIRGMIVWDQSRVISSFSYYGLSFRYYLAKKYI